MHAEALFSRTGRTLEILTSHHITDAFYLAGGTAASLHLGHRRSVDLDFFSGQPFDVETLLQKLKTISEFEVSLKDSKTLTGQWMETRLEFFHYPYPLVDECTEWKEVKIASLKDIALMKLVALSDRGTKKDFFDLFEICQHTITIPTLFSLLSEKFPGVKYDSYHLLKSLSYFEDAEGDPTPDMLKETSWDAVKTFFLEQTRTIEL